MTLYRITIDLDVDDDKRDELFDRLLDVADEYDPGQVDMSTGPIPEDE